MPSAPAFLPDHTPSRLRIRARSRNRSRNRPTHLAQLFIHTVSLVIAVASLNGCAVFRTAGKAGGNLLKGIGSVIDGIIPGLALPF